MSTFFIVATPIGNLGDISLRALETLRAVDLVLCEDTRVTNKLLKHFEIKKPFESFHEHSREAKLEKIIRGLEEGKDIAFVTDAGTPGISDPGAALVARIRSELPLVKIVPIPGPSALTSALSVAGIPADEFLFLGFLPHKKGRQTKIREIAFSQYPVVLYESPHRILKLLKELSGALASDRQIVICRELTKIHEEVKVGSAEELLEYYIQNPTKVRGEFAVIIEATSG